MDIQLFEEEQDPNSHSKTDSLSLNLSKNLRVGE